MTAQANPASALPAAATIMRQAPAENFPVVSRVLPPAMRRHLLALYGFARLVDDTGDESPGDRLALLDQLDEELDRVFAGDEPAHPLLGRLAVTVRECEIPAAPLRALIEANRRDQYQSRYDTFDELRSYCALSANPVGHMVLCVFDASSLANRLLSDDICTALQLVEHCQDVAEDLARGRLYLPAEDLRRFGCSEADLHAPHADERVRALLAFEVLRARSLLARGAPLIGRLRGRPRLAVAGFVAGGRAALAAIERVDYDVLAGAPRATHAERLSALRTTLAEAWRRP